jgi:hypothetical protein
VLLLHAAAVFWALQKVPVKIWEVQPALLTKDYLVEHLGPELTPATAESMMKDLRQLLRLGPDGKMYTDPRYVDWLGLLLESKDPGGWLPWHNHLLAHGGVMPATALLLHVLLLLPPVTISSALKVLTCAPLPPLPLP